MGVSVEKLFADPAATKDSSIKLQIYVDDKSLDPKYISWWDWVVFKVLF